MPKKTYDAIVLGARCAGSPTAMRLATSAADLQALRDAGFPSVEHGLTAQVGRVAVTRPRRRSRCGGWRTVW
jgi:hypothetical protein